MTLYKNKYRVKSHRLKNWDYSNDGCYFLTICTEHKKHWFGKIINEKMILSEFGQIVYDEWMNSFEIRDELFAGEFVVMPNHIHGIVILKNNNNSTVETHSRVSQIRAETNSRSSLPKRIPKSISSFVGGFKSGTVNKIDDFIDTNDLDIDKFNMENKLWQRNYWDRIIRDEKEYDNIVGYIFNNPQNWGNDELYELPHK